VHTMGEYERGRARYASMRERPHITATRVVGIHSSCMLDRGMPSHLLVCCTKHGLRILQEAHLKRLLGRRPCRLLCQGPLALARCPERQRAVL
jgi:hypothetical protein